ncbi:MAG: DUF2220 domain-containing protein [Treponema sp.]|jgi:hypothetical protein|nr:DUF2220 domain-containing protein [Treponema sp.]
MRINWEKRIIQNFVERYFVSLRRAEASGDASKLRNSIRLRTVTLFPTFNEADDDEKESYTEAAQGLAKKKLLHLTYERGVNGKQIKTITCPDLGQLIKKSGADDPRVRAEEIRLILKNTAATWEGALAARGGEGDSRIGESVVFLRQLAEVFSFREVERGMGAKAVEDTLLLFQQFFTPEKLENISTRALSVMLYNDSKRLGYLNKLIKFQLTQIQKQGIAVPDMSFIARSFPEVLISGMIVFDHGEAGDLPPLANASGLVVGFPLESVKQFRAARTLHPKENPTVLIIENKETFFALTRLYGHYDCYLYAGGYINQAVAAMVKLLALSGFCLFHAGDLDPDGILIFQQIQEIAGQPIQPLRMDPATFDRYLPWARPLTPVMIRQLEKIRETTRALPEMSALIRRIEETGRGVEQEIIDYRF